jgi:uncharacterized protein YbaR (Trm112 family)
VNLNPALLEILACPACRSPLRTDEAASELVCTNDTCGLAYPVRDDIPVLLVDEARHRESAAGTSADATGKSAGESGSDAGPRGGNSTAADDA